MIALVVAGIVAAPLPVVAARATTVILVRHGEKAGTPEGDPALSQAGVARATALVEALRGAGVEAVVTTQVRRTRETAQAVAELFRLVPETMDGKAPGHAQEVARRIRERHAGQVVLVVGHSNTVPEIVQALGAPAVPPICDGEYDRMLVVTVDGASSRVVQARYGAPTPQASGCGKPAK